MKQIKISIDNVAYKSKPKNTEAAGISNRIADNKISIDSKESLKQLIYRVGEGGYSFSPATFNGKRNKENFEQMQLMVLDFDGGISFDDVKKRADEYDLPILAAYDTLSSVDGDRFRVMFLNDKSINGKKAANTYKILLMEIFPETDKTDCDIAKMYYGGKKVRYYDEKTPTISVDSTIMSLSYHMEQKYGPTHYKQKIKEFAINNNIRLNSKGFIQNPLTEDGGVSESGKISPKLSVKDNSTGEKLPNYTSENDTIDSVNEKIKINHAQYRCNMLQDISGHCKLFGEFETGKRKLNHDELFGIATNIIKVEKGTSTFVDILSKYNHYYESSKLDKWNYDLKYIKTQNYNAQHCKSFCPHKDKCIHAETILNTAKPKVSTMGKLNNYSEKYYPIKEVQADLTTKLNKAIDASDTRWHIIKAQTAAGKTEAYLRLMEQDDRNYLIAVPTNILKQDIKERAKNIGIELFATPSLDEYEDDIPIDVWNQIKRLRDTGQHTKVYELVRECAFGGKVKALQDFLNKNNIFKEYRGNTVTTHRMLMNMDNWTLDKYDVIIIDEDIILGSIVSNQCEIKVSALKKIRHKVQKINKQRNNTSDKYAKLEKKIGSVLKKGKNKSLIKLKGFKWEYDNESDCDIADKMDLPSFCMSERIMYRKVIDDKSLSDDCITFIKPFNFKDKKYIMVSATVDEEICQYCFGKNNVEFYECKQAKYIGTINQYYEKSMSRSCIDNNKGILERISEMSGFKYMITFKKYAKGDMYFGNAIGCDYLKGENIDVVGTPYYADFLYKLLPFTLKIDVDEEAKMKLCRVLHNGYIFNFTTYDDDNELLRKFQFWMIESELEQAVGRARLLRCDCTVNLYSNFPIRQAVMCEMKDENNVFVKKS